MPVPSRGYQTDAGIDLTAMAVEQKSHGVFLFDSGISIQISDGYYVEIVPRSSIIKTDFQMANSFGVIDPDYRGRILIPFRYIGQGDGLQSAESLLKHRIAQMLLRKLGQHTTELIQLSIRQCIKQKQLIILFC